MNLSLSLTHACNLGCVYCYAGTKRAVTMSAATGSQALAFAFAADEPDMQVGFFGGEPLLEWKLLQQLTGEAETMAAERGVPLKKTVTTNATLLTPERAAWLAGHGFYVGLSIDGNRAMHEATRPLAGGASSFDACMGGLDAALTAFPDFEVITVLDPANIRYAAAGAIFLGDEKQVPRLSLNPNFYTEWSDADLGAWEQAFETLGDWYLARYRAGAPVGLNFVDSKIITGLKDGYACGDRCRFGQGEMAVAPSGRIYPCERLIGDDDNDEVCIGTVAKGFDETKRFRLLAARGNRDPECQDCALQHRCMNWCGCINYTLTGSIDQTGGAVCFHEQLAVRVADRVGHALFEEGNAPFVERFYEN